MKLAPDRETFWEVLGSTGDLHADMEKFFETSAPISSFLGN